MVKKIGKKWIILFSILVLIVIVRLSLPYFVLRYANKVLNETKGYKGHIDDVDLHIYRGAYSIKGIVIKKINSNIPTPFVDIEKADLSIEWPAIWKGKVAGEIVLEDADLNFVGGKDEKNAQAGGNNDWTVPIKKLTPLNINKFQIKNGKISYLDFSSKPDVNVFVKDLNLTATNLSNAYKSSERLPSTIKVTGSSIGGGTLNIEAKANLLKRIPDIDVNLKLTKVTLTSLNKFTQAYGKFDFEKGSLSLFTEIAMADGKIDGYVKPILHDVQILDLKNENEKNIFKKVWEGILEVTEEVLQNQKKEQFATKTPIRGTVKEIKTGVWTSVLNILKNAFIEAFSQNVDEDINFADAQKEEDKKDEKKKEDKKGRKEKRKEKREKKKEEREKKREEKEKEKKAAK